MKFKKEIIIAVIPALLLLSIFNYATYCGGVSPWVPDQDDVPPGMTLVGGITFQADEDPLYTGETNVRVDFWDKDIDNRSVVSVTLVGGDGTDNSTNPFNIDPPQPLSDNVEAFSEAYSEFLSSGSGITINTLWDLLTKGIDSIDTIAGLVSGFTSSESYETSYILQERYPYLDIGFAVFSENITLVYAKDIDLAIMAISTTDNELSLKRGNGDSSAGNYYIGEMNDVVDSIFSIVELTTSSESDESPIPSSDADIDDAVLYMVDHLSFTYGDKSAGLVPGYPLSILFLFSMGIIAILLRRYSKNQK